MLDHLQAVEYQPPQVIESTRPVSIDDYFSAVKHHASCYGNVETFQDLPIINKAFARQHYDDLRNKAYRGRVFSKKTAGSTGEPFSYLASSLAQSYLWAGILLSWMTAGYRLGQRVAFLAAPALAGGNLRKAAFYGLMNFRLLSAFDLTPGGLDSYLEAIGASRCRLLYGYAAAVFELARHALKKGLGTSLHLTAVVCTAEVLTDAMRSTIENAFGCPCFSQYGCNDAGVSGYECEARSGFHLITDRCHAEVVDGRRLVATDLTNLAFFLPRYDTGDYVRPSDSPCVCGRGFPLIREVLGRSNDVVVDASGNVVHSEFFSHLVRGDRTVKAFQVLYDDHRLVLNLASDGRSVERARAYHEAIVQRMTFEQVSIVNDYPLVGLQSGKRQFVVKVNDVSQYLHAASACACDGRGSQVSS